MYESAAAVIASGQRAMRAYRAALGRFARRPEVTGVDVGFRYRGGKPTEEVALRIHVREKISLKSLPQTEWFPDTIEGFPVDVLQAVYRSCDSLHAVSKRQDGGGERVDPLQPGVSVGHRDGGGGSLGLIVIDNRTRKPAILSNWHVLVGLAAAELGDPVIQPCQADGGCHPRDTVGYLERSCLDTDGDAAIALLNGQRDLVHAMVGTEDMLVGCRQAMLGEFLTKSGAATGITHGRVDGVGRYFLSFSQGRRGIDGFKLASPDGEDDFTGPVAGPGDSGAVWYAPDSLEGCGLHFASEEAPALGQRHALACHLPRVLQRLDVSIASHESKTPRQNPSSILSMSMGRQLSARVLGSIDAQDLQQRGAELLLIYPELRQIVEESYPPTDEQDPVGPLGAVAIGFAMGAAARLVDLRTEQVRAESFPLLVTAFLAGSVAASRTISLHGAMVPKG